MDLCSETGHRVRYHFATEWLCKRDGLGCGKNPARNRTIRQQTSRGRNEVAGASDDFIDPTGLF